MEKRIAPDAPVLLITFNRPDDARKVFNKIREAKVKRLYVFNDAPRAGNNEDQNARIAIKNLLKEVDWDCNLYVNFQEKNLGCGTGPATALTWAFEKEDRLIILEDDCVPSPPFFKFCNHCLDMYKDDTRVWMVSGRSHQQFTRFFADFDYIFSHYGHGGGWATWKRCWNYFDIEMKEFPEFIKNGGYENVFYSKKEGRLYNEKYTKLFADKCLKTHAWDFQFGFSIISHGGLSIIPAKNLIENIGYMGTHSSKKNSYHELKANEDFSIAREPMFVLANREYDLHHFEHHIMKIFGQPPLYKRILK
jgi:hypothetical protein